MYKGIFQKKGLSLERLHTLVCVANAPSLSSAAGHDPVRQSQFSRQIRELETYFECLLTHRNGKTLVMSPAGRRLAQITRLYITALERFQAEQNGKTVRLRVGAGERIVHWLLTPSMRAIEKACSPVSFCFHNMASTEIVSRLYAGELDAGIVRAADGTSSHLHRKKLGILRYALFVPKALAPGGDVPATKIIKQVPLADLHQSARVRKLTRPYRGHQPLQVNLRYECATLPGVARLVAAGQAAGLLPIRAAGELPQDTVKQYDLPLCSPVHEHIWLIWNSRCMELFPRLSCVLNSITGELKRMMD